MDSGSGKLVRDGVIILLSVCIAILLAKTGTIDAVLHSFNGSFALTAFLAGILFTSVFTTPIGIASFIVLGIDGYNPFVVALVGALGSLLGDSIIYRFVKIDIVDDIEFIEEKSGFKRVLHIFRKKKYRWITPFLGALIIASPLPDELGIGMLAVSKIKFKYFLIVSYVLNFFGILTLVFFGEIF
ncbi:MAG TPA: hypothetical protein VJC10_02835 [Patescibacteria group bacterium]|nr:hypothetical protein [Patescibacteria group bacterium]